MGAREPRRASAPQCFLRATIANIFVQSRATAFAGRARAHGAPYSWILGSVDHAKGRERVRGQDGNGGIAALAFGTRPRGRPRRRACARRAMGIGGRGGGEVLDSPEVWGAPGPPPP